MMSEDEDVELVMEPTLDTFQLPVYRAFIGSPLTHLSPGAAKKNLGIRAQIRKVFESFRPISFTVYDPAEHTPPESRHTPAQVLVQDHANLVKSDVYVCVASQPSHGVGIEATWAAQASVPRLLVYPNGVGVSKLLLATSARDFTPIAYEDVRDVEVLLRNVIPEIAKSVTSIGPIKRRSFSELRAAARGQFILRRRIQLGMTREDLSKRSLVPVALIAGIESDEVFSLVFGSNQFHLLAGVLNARLIQRDCNIPKFLPNDQAEHRQIVDESLDSLVEFVRLKRPRRDELVVKMWQSYAELQAEALVGREPLDSPLTVAEWERLYRQDQSRLI